MSQNGLSLVAQLAGSGKYLNRSGRLGGSSRGCLARQQRGQRRKLVLRRARRIHLYLYPKLVFPPQVPANAEKVSPERTGKILPVWVNRHLSKMGWRSQCRRAVAAPSSLAYSVPQCRYRTGVGALASSSLPSEEEVRRELTLLTEGKYSDKRRFLFRGQTSLYPSIPAFIGRLNDKEEIGKAYTILRQFVGRLRGQIALIPQLIAPDADETIALMQHYGWPTPFLDLTDSLKVAFFFATYKPGMAGSVAPPNSAVIYAVDTTLLAPEYRHVQHDDVVDPTLNLRWTIQRGHAIAAAGWPNMEHVRALDLLKLPGLKAYRFQPNRYASKEDEARYLPPLDPVANRLASLVSLVAQGIGLNPLPPVLARFPF